MRLRLNVVPRLVGDSAKQRFFELYDVLVNSRWPIYLVGPSGSGKTIMAMNLAKQYSRDFHVPAYYVQLSPDQTKTSLILGLRLINGSLVPTKGVTAEAMDNGGVLVVDEATHATQELLLMFNSVCDRTAITSIGDEIIYAKDTFRIIFCGNTSSYAGNVKLPQSFAQRLVAYRFDYPSWDDEVKISKKMLEDEYKGEVLVPRYVLAYLTSLMREVRSEDYPLSVRNVVATAIILNARRPKLAPGKVEEVLRSISGSQAEATLRRLYKRVYNVEARSTNEITTDDTIVNFLAFIGGVTIDAFRDAVLSGFMYYLDVDGFSANVNEMKNKLVGAIL